MLAENLTRFSCDQDENANKIAIKGRTVAVSQLFIFLIWHGMKQQFTKRTFLYTYDNVKSW